MADQDSDDLDDLAGQLEPESGADETIGDALGEQDIAQMSPGSKNGRREAVYDVSIDVVAILGTTTLQVSQILKLGRGAVVELDRGIGEPVELRANNQLVAFGEVVVMEDRLAIKLTDVAKSEAGPA